MRIVDEPVIRPHKCAVLPQVGGVRARGYVDTGNDLDREHVYISDIAVGELCKAFGFPTPEQMAVVVAERDELRERAARLERELEDGAQVLQAIDVIESVGFRTRKKPGRPRRETVNG